MGVSFDWGLNSLSLVAVGGALGVTIHAILYRREPRAAMGWIVVSWLLPIVGPTLYFFLGINRVERKGRVLRQESVRAEAHRVLERAQRGKLQPRPENQTKNWESLTSLAPLVLISDRINAFELTPGNEVLPLRNGDEAFPEMLKTIRSAKRSITLMSYIFDEDSTGFEFVAELVAARKRGVEVRVLLDDIGAGSLFSRVRAELKNGDVRVKMFHQTLLPRHLPFINLRNHRKLLIVDAEVAFTGGMNISDRHWKSKNPRAWVLDLHFRLRGPIVRHLQEVFEEDWHFATDEWLTEPFWPKEEKIYDSASFARAIPDGPYGSGPRIHQLFLGALTVAKKSIKIQTPYFLPDSALILAFSTAALRGVSVEIILPSKSDSRIADWAARAMLWQVLQNQCRVYFSPDHFDHSKLIVVDDCWISFGSVNWDSRSLRLNFELNVEVYDATLAKNLSEYFDEKKRISKEVFLKELNGRSIFARLRDGFFRLFSPYL